MAKSTNTTPEKIKQLLSSFLIPSHQPNDRLLKSQSSPPQDNTQQQTPVKRKATNSGTNILRSYESFLARLDSFSSLTWFGKPSELSPLICARYGWENVDIDMLQCVGCKASLSGQLPAKTDIDTYSKFKEKLKENLLAGHDRFCALAANPCPETFCIVRCDDPVTLTSGLIARISALDSIKHHLPPIDYTSIHKYSFDQGQGAAYCTRHLMPGTEVTPEVVTLSVAGWTKSSSSDVTLMCSMCRRLIGLWNFSREGNGSLSRQSDDQDENGDTNGGDDREKRSENSEVSEPSPKRRKKMVTLKKAFDPLEEHKYWCPWTAPTTLVLSSNSSSTPDHHTESQVQPACIIALKAIAPGLMDNNKGLAQTLKVSPVVEGLRSFRQVIKAWSSPKSSTTQVAVTTSS